MSSDDFFLDNLPLIEEVIQQTCGRAHFRWDQAEEFAGWVRLKLYEDDCRILQKFKGGSSLKTYLVVVIKRLLLDYRIQEKGKWRPCAEAERLGEVAILLDTLLHRDGYTFDEACEILRTNYQVKMSDSEFSDLRARLAPRSPRRIVGEGPLESKASQEPPPDERAEARERRGLKRRLYAHLHKAFASLPKEDRLILAMRLKLDFQVVRIARVLQLDQKALYRRIEKIIKELRQALEREGVRRQDIEEILRLLEPE